MNSNDIYLAAGSIFHWDGISSIAQPVYSRLDISNPNCTIEKLWGISNSPIIGIGNAGSIVNYQNDSWQKIESGTELTVHDIWGSSSKVLAIASEIFEVKDKKIFSISPQGVTELPNTGLSWSMVTVWFPNNFIEYAGGSGLYRRYDNENSWKEITLPDYYTYSIRGNGPNDIIISGGYGYVAHYNGSTWKGYLDKGLELINGNYYSVSIKGNTAVTVGTTVEGKAVVAIGKR